MQMFNNLNANFHCLAAKKQSSVRQKKSDALEIDSFFSTESAEISAMFEKDSVPISFRSFFFCCRVNYLKLDKNWKGMKELENWKSHVYCKLLTR